MREKRMSEKRLSEKRLSEKRMSEKRMSVEIFSSLISHPSSAFLIAIVFAILGFAASACAFNFLGWDLNWWGDSKPSPVANTHSGYKVSGGYYLLSPSRSQSYIQHP
jgi:hypothetical protein